MTGSIADQWLGTGLRFPLRPDPATGNLEIVDGMTRIRQSIEQILYTELGERIMLPGFGCGLRHYVMEPNTLTTRTAMGQDIETALTTWEPRIRLERRHGDAGRPRPDGAVDRDLVRAVVGPAAGQPRLPVLPEVGAMALISPILDDRSFAQLKDELVRRIPVYTNEWTDHNETDPGIALLELFAYLGESVLYRFNQIPETTKIEFLRLLGVQARPARPATAVIAGTTDLAAGVQIPLSTAVTAGKVPFRTSGETYVWPLDCLAVGKIAAPDLPKPPAGDVIANARYRAEKARRDDARARAGLTAQQTATFYATTQLAADPNDPDAAPLDVSTTLDQLLWIAVLRKKNTDLALLRDQSLFVGLAFDEAVDRPFDLRQLGPDQTQAFHSDGLTSALPPMVWRLWNGPGRDATTLAVGSDTTRGLVTSGVVELLLPHQLPDLATLPPGAGDQSSPPPLADEIQAAAVVAWINVGRARPAISTTRSTRCAGPGSTRPRSCSPGWPGPSCSAPGPATPGSVTRSRS